MATEIAKAYVQIVPSMQGIQAQLSKSLAPAVETSGKESGQKMGNALAGGLKSAASSIGKAFTAAAKAAAVGFGAAAAAVAAVGKSALNAYADYEQLVGGVETLFGNASDKVLRNANRAFQTAGLSANEYMETVTSFSASLLQSVGKDTKKRRNMPTKPLWICPIMPTKWAAICRTSKTPIRVSPSRTIRCSIT